MENIKHLLANNLNKNKINNLILSNVFISGLFFGLLIIYGCIFGLQNVWLIIVFIFCIAHITSLSKHTITTILNNDYNETINISLMAKLIYMFFILVLITYLLNLSLVSIKVEVKLSDMVTLIVTGAVGIFTLYYLRKQSQREKVLNYPSVLVKFEDVEFGKGSIISMKNESKLPIKITARFIPDILCFVPNQSMKLNVTENIKHNAPKNESNGTINFKITHSFLVTTLYLEIEYYAKYDFVINIFDYQGDGTPYDESILVTDIKVLDKITYDAELALIEKHRQDE